MGCWFVGLERVDREAIGVLVHHDWLVRAAVDVPRADIDEIMDGFIIEWRKLPFDRQERE